MLNKRFCYLAGTGRTATHWIKRLIDASCDQSKVVAFHDGFFQRAKTSRRRNPAQFFTNYLLNLMVRRQGAETYVECNPALLEHVALTYGVNSALNVIPGGFLAQSAKSLLLVRHPYTYVASLKAEGWSWQWWTYPRAAQVFEVGQQFGSKGIIEQAAAAWYFRNEFYLSLMRSPDCLLLKFEHLFGHQVTKNTFSERIQKLFVHFGIEPIRGSSLWWQLRSQKDGAKNKTGIKLNAEERQTVRWICGSMMEYLEYS